MYRPTLNKATTTSPMSRKRRRRGLAAGSVAGPTLGWLAGGRAGAAGDVFADGAFAGVRVIALGLGALVFFLARTTKLLAHCGHLTALSEGGRPTNFRTALQAGHGIRPTGRFAGVVLPVVGASVVVLAGFGAACLGGRMS